MVLNLAKIVLENKINIVLMLRLETLTKKESNCNAYGIQNLKEKNVKTKCRWNSQK